MPAWQVLAFTPRKQVAVRTATMVLVDTISTPTRPLPLKLYGREKFGGNGMTDDGPEIGLQHMIKAAHHGSKAMDP